MVASKSRRQCRIGNESNGKDICLIGLGMHERKHLELDQGSIESFVVKKKEKKGGRGGLDKRYVVVERE